MTCAGYICRHHNVTNKINERLNKIDFCIRVKSVPHLEWGYTILPPPSHHNCFRKKLIHYGTDSFGVLIESDQYFVLEGFM